MHKYTILILLSMILLSGCTTCGDGVLDEGETPETCCIDAGCYGDQTCNEVCVDPVCNECQYLEDHVCKDYECCSSSECGFGAECSNHECIPLECGDCEITMANTCQPTECCSDSECDDQSSGTMDYCSYLTGTCVNVEQRMCIDDDGYCPRTCTNVTDNDCFSNTLNYMSYPLGFAFNYPSDWEMLRLPNGFQFSPPIVDGARYNASVLILSTPRVNKSVSLEELADHLYSQYKYYFGMTIVEINEPTSLGGLPGRQLLMRDYGTYRIHNRFAYNDERIFEIILFARKGDYEFYEPLFNNLKWTFSEADKPIHKVENPLLWEVNGSYVFGSYHVNDPHYLDLVPRIWEAFDVTDSVYTEYVVSDIASLKQVDMFDSSKSLKRDLSTDVYNNLKELYRLKGVDIETLDNLKLSHVLATLIVPELDLSANASSMDQFFSTKAIAQGKTVGALETGDVNEVLDFGFTDQEIVSMLEESLDYAILEARIGSSSLLDEIYSKGDENKLLGLFGNSTPSDVTLLFNEKFLVERNEKISDRIDSIIEKRPNDKNFFIVGAGHLAGEDGILQQLRLKGYKVKRVN